MDRIRLAVICPWLLKAGSALALLLDSIVNKGVSVEQSFRVESQGDGLMCRRTQSVMGPIGGNYNNCLRGKPRPKGVYCYFGSGLRRLSGRLCSNF